MARRPPPTLSRMTDQALQHLAARIRAARLERSMSAAELAERVGVSRAFIQRLEKGDPRCQIGAVFEAAVIVGVPLFGGDREAIAVEHRATREKLALLPKRGTNRPLPEVDDDF